MKKIKIENKQWNVKKIFLLNAEQKKNTIICKLLEDKDKTEMQQNEVKTFQTPFKKRTSENNNLCNENLENIQFEQITTWNKYLQKEINSNTTNYFFDKKRRSNTF
ncbi:hypothetical protein [Spiroplasma endosymbiont of Lasioglossum malachurum]|uniref:hypothetical protein n=1 Tax=Spiroplasma endosymbiont of Lasioglossum malachurum TaxID=3066319 RepID=UPI0030CACF51